MQECPELTHRIGNEASPGFSERSIMLYEARTTYNTLLAVEIFNVVILEAIILFLSNLFPLRRKQIHKTCFTYKGRLYFSLDRITAAYFNTHSVKHDSCVQCNSSTCNKQ